MIQSVSTAEHKTEYLRRIANKPYFEAVLGTHLRLFGQHPASGWAFYLLPGTAVLELRGGSGALCGGLPDDEDTREELQGFLRFLHVDCLRCEHPLSAAYANTWQSGKPLTLWTLHCLRQSLRRESGALRWTLPLRCCPSAAWSLPRAMPRPTNSTPPPARLWPMAMAPAALCCTMASPSAR